MSKENKNGIFAELEAIRAALDSFFSSLTVTAVSLPGKKESDGSIVVGLHGNVDEKDLSKVRKLGEDAKPVSYGPGENGNGDSSVY